MEDKSDTWVLFIHLHGQGLNTFYSPDALRYVAKVSPLLQANQLNPQCKGDKATKRK